MDRCNHSRVTRFHCSCRKNFVFSVVDRYNHSRVTRFHCSCRKNFVLRSWTVAITLVLLAFIARAERTLSCGLGPLQSLSCYTVTNPAVLGLGLMPCARHDAVSSAPSSGSALRHAPSRPALIVSRSFPSCPASRSFPSCPDCVSRSFPSCSVCHAPSRLLPVLLCVSRSFPSPSRPALCVTLLPVSFPSCSVCHAPSRLLPVLLCVSRSFPSCPDCVTLLPVLP